jgi:hypothetical protein
MAAEEGILQQLLWALAAKTSQFEVEIRGPWNMKICPKRT